VESEQRRGQQYDCCGVCCVFDRFHMQAQRKINEADAHFSHHVVCGVA